MSVMKLRNNGASILFISSLEKVIPGNTTIMLDEEIVRTDSDIAMCLKSGSLFICPPEGMKTAEPVAQVPVPSTVANQPPVQIENEAEREVVIATGKKGPGKAKTINLNDQPMPDFMTDADVVDVFDVDEFDFLDEEDPKDQDIIRVGDDNSKEDGGIVKVQSK